MVAILRGDGHLAGTVLAADPAEIQGVNDRVQLAQVRRAYNGRLLEAWMRAGVTIMDPSSTWVDVDVTLAPDAEILPGTHLEGRTDIGAGARIGPGCLLRDTSVGQDATVLYAVCESAEIGPGATRRAVRPAAPGHPDRPGRAHRHLCRAEERRRWARGPRCRTCPTWATRTSASTRTSARPRSS